MKQMQKPNTSQMDIIEKQFLNNKRNANISTFEL